MMRLAARPLTATSLVVAASVAFACHDSEPAGDRSAAGSPSVTITTLDTSAAPTPASAAQSRRIMSPAPTHVRWIRGGSERDTVFSFPRTLAVDDRYLYVLDADGHDLSALRTTNGSLAWRVGGRQDSSVVPVALAAAPGHFAIVADAGHSRLLTLGRDGHPAATIPFAAATAARSLCALPDGSVVVAGADPAGALLRVAPGDPAGQRLPPPWPDLATHHRLATQLTVASARDDSACVVALALGRGFALFDGRDYRFRQRYVESFDLPHVVTTTTGDSAAFTRVERLDDTRIAARDVALSSARIVVAFDGTSPLRAHVLDFYDRHTGAYVASIPIPGRVTAVADDGHDLYVAFTRHGRAAVAAIPYPAAHAAAAADSARPAE